MTARRVLATLLIVIVVLGLSACTDTATLRDGPASWDGATWDDAHWR